MMMLEGFDEDTGRDIGRQEKAARRIVDYLGASHPEYDPVLDGLCQSLLSLGENIDRQNSRGREISRNMAQYIDALWKIRDMFPTEQMADEDVEAAWSGEPSDAD
ncbi:hypothetical protein [Bifidobacterium cebidarum]|uniref:Uncharacterized protein n=1 Tax=Bifidobacterium cebidarum TaxID=2650773 RepID=A0A6I1GCT5_9BIFI|nr:hypothetical protein [Bifidobacterium cebidarum]KAB7789453.1 hypothetical protein F7D08_0405 [Bifidobacterium cebidarum]